MDSQNHTLLELHHYVLEDIEEIESINIYIMPLKSESAKCIAIFMKVKMKYTFISLWGFSSQSLPKNIQKMYFNFVWDLGRLLNLDYMTMFFSL